MNIILPGNAGPTRTFQMTEPDQIQNSWATYRLGWKLVTLVSLSRMVCILSGASLYDFLTDKRKNQIKKVWCNNNTSPHLSPSSVSSFFLPGNLSWKVLLSAEMLKTITSSSSTLFGSSLRFLFSCSWTFSLSWLTSTIQLLEYVVPTPASEPKIQVFRGPKTP